MLINNRVCFKTMPIQRLSAQSIRRHDKVTRGIDDENAYAMFIYCILSISLRFPLIS